MFLYFPTNLITARDRYATAIASCPTQRLCKVNNFPSIFQTLKMQSASRNSAPRKPSLMRKKKTAQKNLLRERGSSSSSRSWSENVQKPVEIMKSSMEAPTAAPTNTSFKYHLPLISSPLSFSLYLLLLLLLQQQQRQESYISAASFCCCYRLLTRCLSCKRKSDLGLWKGRQRRSGFRVCWFRVCRWWCTGVGPGTWVLVCNEDFGKGILCWILVFALWRTDRS